MRRKKYFSKPGEKNKILFVEFENSGKDNVFPVLFLTNAHGYTTKFSNQWILFYIHYVTFIFVFNYFKLRGEKKYYFSKP